MVVTRCTRCGAPISKAPSFCKCGAYVLAEDRPVVARGGDMAESSATITEAFTYVPPVEVPAAQQIEALPDLERMPYKYGYFIAVVQMLIGFLLVVFGVVSFANPSSLALAVLCTVGGVLSFWLGLALFQKKDLAMRIVIGCYGLGILGQILILFMALLGNLQFSNLIGAVLSIGVSIICINYFYKRLA